MSTVVFVLLAVFFRKTLQVVKHGEYCHHTTVGRSLLSSKPSLEHFPCQVILPGGGQAVRIADRRWKGGLWNKTTGFSLQYILSGLFRFNRGAVAIGFGITATCVILRGTSRASRVVTKPTRRVLVELSADGVGDCSAEG